MSNVIDFEQNVYIFNGLEIPVIVDTNNSPWFGGKIVAELLEYEKYVEAIHLNVACRNKITFSELISQPIIISQPLNFHSDKYQSQFLYVDEEGICCLLFNSKATERNTFKLWLIMDLLPSFKLNKLKAEFQSRNNFSSQLDSFELLEQRALKSEHHSELAGERICQLETELHDAYHEIRDLELTASNVYAVEYKLQFAYQRIKTLELEVQQRVRQLQQANLISNQRIRALEGQVVRVTDLQRRAEDNLQNYPDNPYVFLIIDKRVVNSEYPYYVIRCQRIRMNERLRDVKLMFPNMKIVLELSREFRMVRLFCRIRENPNFSTRDNHFRSNLNEAELITLIKKLVDEIDD